MEAGARCTQGDKDPERKRRKAPFHVPRQQGKEPLWGPWKGLSLSSSCLGPSLILGLCRSVGASLPRRSPRGSHVKRTRRRTLERTLLEGCQRPPGTLDRKERRRRGLGGRTDSTPLHPSAPLRPKTSGLPLLFLRGFLGEFQPRKEGAIKVIRRGIKIPQQSANSLCADAPDQGEGQAVT